MNSIPRAATFFLVTLVLSSVAAVGRPSALDPGDYFGFLNRLDEAEIERLLDRLEFVFIDCAKRVEEDCPCADDALEMIFGRRRHELADILWYARQQYDQLEATLPVLMWKRRHTPHIRDADFVWALVFSDTRIPLSAENVAIHQQPTNPFSGLISKISLSPGAGGATPPEPKAVCLAWGELTRPDVEPPFYLGIARLPVGEESVNLLTVYPDAECKKQPVHAAAPRRNSLSRRVKLQPARSLTAHFSNSRGARVAFGVGFGSTFNVEGTALSDGEDDSSTANGYALSKVYIRRPRLKAFQSNPRAGVNRSRKSLAFVIGTSVDDLFDEILLGFSWGHVLGNVGFFAGANLTPAKDDAGTVFEEKWRPIVGFEYTF